MYVRIKRVPIPLIIPLRIFYECLEAVEDILLFAGRCFPGLDAKKTLETVENVVFALAALGKFDLAEVEAGNAVKVRICLR